MQRNGEGLNHELEEIIRDDVIRHCNGVNSKTQLDISEHFRIVQNLLDRELSISFLNPAETMIKLGKGGYTKSCVIDIGLNAAKTCFVYTGLYGEYHPEYGCDYCYAAHQNSGSFISSIYRVTGGEFRELLLRKIEESDFANEDQIFLRLGQNVEMNIPLAFRKKYKKVIIGHDKKGHPIYGSLPYNLDLFLKGIIDIREETGKDIRCVMPTKIPEFTSETMELLKAARVSVMVSVAYQQLEPGVLNHGFNVKRRLQGALALSQAGVNTNIYLATDLTRPMKYLQPEGEMVLQFLEANKYSGIGLQFLDMRMTKKSHSKIIAGMHWDKAVKKLDDRLLGLPGCSLGGGTWGLTGSNYAYGLNVHESFLNMMFKSSGMVRMCNTHIDEPICGGCFMDRC